VVEIITTESNKIDIIEIRGNTLFHKQIEQKNGMTFLRLKKRKIATTE